ncbi:MAG: hypothetical protein PVJ67_05925 [Candidatus Pacearchaeota archaeon]|jgi:hypothetical protein
MKDYVREIEDAKRYVAEGKFERGDECFYDIFCELRSFGASEEIFNYIYEKYQDYVNIKKNKLENLLIEADVFAGKGDVDSVVKRTDVICLVAAQMIRGGTLSKERGEEIFFYVKDIKNVAYHIGIPVALSGLEFYHAKNDGFKRRDFLIKVRSFGNYIGVDVEGAVVNVMGGERLLGLYDTKR